MIDFHNALSSIYKFFNSESPDYFNEIYFLTEPININTRSSFQSLKQPFSVSIQYPPRPLP